jgi:mono/diheme cytochrome c family protein
VLLGLSTGHSVGLAVVAGIFIVFALASALVIPRRWPEFPGENLRWFLVATLVLFVATLAAVEVFAKEPKEATAAEKAKETPGTTTQATAPAPAPTGDPAAGKEVFLAQGCGNCHTFSAGGSTGAVGPNLDEVLKGKDAAFIRESIVDPNKQIAKGYAPNVMPRDFGQKLTPKQIDDLVAFLTQG